MKRKILSSVLIVIMSVVFFQCNQIVARAAQESEDIDLSYLLTDNALIGYSENQSRGVYYSNGYSVINKISSTKIGAGGVTNANIRCRVAVTSIVERQTSTGWAFVTSWTQTNENALSAMVSKSLTVGKGYWYRVRSSHYASTDVSSSATDALWMSN